MLLNYKPLGGRIPGLNPFGTAIFEAGAVVAIFLTAALIQKATHGHTAWVFRILTTVRHLQVPELHHGGNIRIYRALGKEGAFLSIASTGYRSYNRR